MGVGGTAGSASLFVAAVLLRSRSESQTRPQISQPALITASPFDQRPVSATPMSAATAQRPAIQTRTISDFFMGEPCIAERMLPGRALLGALSGVLTLFLPGLAQSRRAAEYVRSAAEEYRVDACGH